MVAFSKAAEKHPHGRQIQRSLLGALLDLTDHLNGKQMNGVMNPAPDHQAAYVLAVMQVIETVAGPDVRPADKVFEVLGVKVHP
jgi:hypothetical protein